jgi:hypothetical protein
MGFETVILADVKIERPAPVPAGKGYTFQLQPGAAYRVNSKSNIQELNVRFDVADGEFAGRPVFVSYPDPTAVAKDKVDQQTGAVTAGKPMSWSAQALKKLEIALGTDSLPGEDPATYLNRVALNSHSRITADILPGRTYTDNKSGETKTMDPQFGIFTVGAAA